jgi:hypothetical protein
MIKLLLRVKLKMLIRIYFRVKHIYFIFSLIYREVDQIIPKFVQITNFYGFAVSFSRVNSRFKEATSGCDLKKKYNQSICQDFIKKLLYIAFLKILME